MKACKLFSVVVAVASTLFVALSASAEFTCELSFPQAPSTALANFPVLVRLAEDAPTGFSYADCPTASCIWFTDEGGTDIPFEVDTWDSTSNSLVWVSVPSLSSSAKITMHWDASGAPAGLPAAREVWTRAGYNAVWHFSGSNAESVTNLLPSATRGTPTYDGNVSYPGPVGKTLWLNGSSDLRYAPNPAWTTLGDGPALSVSFFVRSSSGGFTRMISCMSDWRKPAGYEFTFQSSNTKITVGSSNESQMQTDITTGPNTKWKHFAGTWSGTTVKFYDDGSKAKEATLNAVVAPTEALTFGAQGGSNTGAPLTGGLDEIRIRRETSSDDWVAAEYATATDANYVSFGEVEEAAAVMSFEFGTPSVSSVSATGATISARLKGIGDNATSANLWVVVTGFGQTRAYPLDPATEPKVVEATLSGLQLGADWTAYLTATNNLGAGVDSALAAFSTLSDADAGSPGLYQGVTHAQATAQDAAANWDIAASDVVTFGPLAMRSSGTNHDFWQAVDGTSFTWANNTGFGYAGYMYMEGGKDYYFGASADDAGYVWVDNGDANWDAKRTDKQFGGYGNWKAAGPYAIAETGYYRVVFASWNGSGGAGAEPTTSVLFPKLRYIALESGATAPAMADEGWCEAVDPGDGSLFFTEAPTRSVTVISAVRDGTLLSAKVALGEVFPGESSVLRYVYGATNGGNDPADWEGGSLVASSLPAGVVTNDYLVGIAADTRYVRFYMQDGDAFTWYATISLDWAGEGSVAGGFIFLGDPDASAVSGDSATLSAILNAPGADATSAQAWFVLSGGGETQVIPAGTATARTNLAVTVTGLTPETTYTFHATATNNAATPVGIDSAVATFTTGAGASAWNTSRATFTPDGKSLTATIPVTSLGVGTTTLYLMTGGNWNSENTVSASQVVTSPGEQTLTATFPDSPWGTKVYYSLMLVNGTAESATTNWPNENVAGKNVFYNKSFELQDNSTYTWIGGASGVWNDPTQWNRTAGNLASEQPAGYPVHGSTALFATNDSAAAVTVTLPSTPGTSIADSSACWAVSTLNYQNMKAPITFTSDTTDWTSRIRIGGQTQNIAIDLTFDHCAVWINQQRSLGAYSVDANGKNSIYTFTHGTVADWSTIYPERPGVAIRVKDGAWLKVGAIGMCGVSDADHPPVIEVEDAELRCAGPLTPDSNGTSGALYRLLGSHPKLEFVSCQTANDNSTDVVEFFVPVGGYTEPPLHFWGDAVINSSGKANLTLRIAADSPALSAGVATTTRFVNGKVADGATAPKVAFDLPTGVTTSTFTDPNGNADGYVVSIPAGAGPALANVGIASCKDNSFTIAGTLSIATANESATITSYVAEDGGDFAAKGTATSGGGVFSVKASGLVSGTKYRWYVEAVTPSGSFRTVEQVLTFFPGAAVVSDASVAPTSVDGEKVYVFTDSETPGSITFAKGGLVEVLVVGGGGAGGSTYGGGGGGGAFLHRDDFIPAGTYEVTVGKGGYNTKSSGTPPVAAESSSIGALFVAPGGGAGALLNTKYGTALGGSAGGDCGGNGTAAPLRGIWPFGTDGGATGNSGGAFSPGAGGGGAGGPGSDRRTWGGVQLGGKGGDGVACSITGESVFYAAGGGGGAYNADLLPGAAGLGGVSGSAHGDAERHDAPANTGSGGGGGGPTTTQGGSGGSGIVVIRVKKFDKIGFSIIVR